MPRLPAILWTLLWAAYPAIAQSPVEQAGADALRQHRLPEAESAFLSLTRSNPNNDSYWNILGVIHDGMGRPAEAASDFKRAIRLNSSSVSAHYNLALNLLQRKMLGEARVELDSALRLNPALAPAHYNLGSLDAETGRLPSALEHLSAAHRLEPANTQVTLRLAEIYYHAGNYPAAIDLLQGPSPALSKSAMRFYLAGLCYSASAKAGLAVDNLAKAVELAPEKADYVYDLGIMLVNAAQDARAFQIFRDAASRFPKVPKIQFGHALAAYLNGQSDEAERAMAVAIHLDPRPGEMFTSLGDIYAGLGRKKDALEAFRKAQTFEPASAALFRRQGTVLYEMNDLTASRQAFEHAIVLDPADGAAQYGLAKISLGLQDFDGALRQFEKTVQIDPQNRAAYYQLALLYRRNHDSEKAAVALSAFRKLKGASAQGSQESPDELK